MSVNILGVRVDDYSREEVLLLLDKALRSNQTKVVATVNPEILVDAHKDIDFRRALNQSDIAVADGIGVILISYLLGRRIKYRLTGVNLMSDICQSVGNQKIMLLGARGDSAQKAAQVLSKKFPNNQYFYLGGTKADENKLALQYINSVLPSVIFVAFGHGKQEKWIYDNLQSLQSVRVAMGVGGSFDYISGNVNRAPVWMRRAGSEWLFRLFKQPWRILRVLKATVYFFFLSLININKH